VSDGADGAGQDVGRLLAGVFADHQVVDLSVPLDERLPCTWPGHMPFRATVSSWFADRPADPQPVHAGSGAHYQTRWLVMDEHAGTHLDAPRHFIPPVWSGLPNAGVAGDIGVDQLPLLAAAGAADVIDVGDISAVEQTPAGVSPRVTPRHLERWEAEHGPVAAGDVALLHSGWDRHYQEGQAGSRYGTDVLVDAVAPGWPAPTPAAIDWLLDRGVRCVGTDGLSIGAADDGEAAHLAALPHGMAVVEALSGLDQLPPRGAWFLFLPIRLVGGTGGPGRALGVLPGGGLSGAPAASGASGEGRL
jgi:kynurenine formamidase